MQNELIQKPQPVRKPRKGECGTCHWFERVAEEPKPGVPWAGRCYANPPAWAQTAVQGFTPGGPGMIPKEMGVRPPTFETDRCEKWRPFGKLPDAATEQQGFALNRAVESAPKDGSEILAYGFWAGEVNGPSEVASFSVIAWQGGKTDWPGFEWRVANSDHYAEWFKPLYWWPLPESKGV